MLGRKLCIKPAGCVRLCVQGRAIPLDITHILDGLNEPQRQAVSNKIGNSLVVAGAGSGKTRVLVHRVAYLIGVCGIPADQILAVTFTNKAAGEMKERVEKLLGPVAQLGGAVSEVRSRRCMTSGKGPEEE